MLKYFFFLLLVPIVGCHKFLDKKPSPYLKVPERLEDLQAILDYTAPMNTQGLDFLEQLADNYYVNSVEYHAAPEEDRLSYIWHSQAVNTFAWNNPYRKVYYANFILDALPGIPLTTKNAGTYAEIRAAALFHRAFAFFQLAQIFALPYHTDHLGQPGIVLRLTAAIEDQPGRASLAATYDRILGDLKESADALPVATSFSTRPTKAAAYALLARVLLSMRNYGQAFEYADKCLRIQNTLIDYNTLVPVGSPAIKSLNEETLFFHHALGLGTLLYPTIGKVDSSLVNLYSTEDLRREVFLADNGDGTYQFRGSYAGNYWEPVVFDGLATDEIYLIRAESAARNGDLSAALADLNTLLSKRWRSGSFVPYALTDRQTLIELILTERRKELLYRGVRWSDLRRLNLEGANITLKRKVDDTIYELAPGDPRWVALIPPETIQRSGIQQNPR